MPKLGLGSSIGKKSLTTPGVISTGRTIWAPFDSPGQTGTSYTGQALEFDGVTDHFALPPIELNSSGDFTFAVWVNLDDVSDGGKLISGPGGFEIEIDAVADKLRIRSSISASSQQDMTHGMSDSTWHRIVYTQSGTSAKLYNNGALVSSATQAQQVDSGTNYTGYFSKRHSTHESDYVACKACDLQMWDAEWSATDVLNDYNNPQDLALNFSNASLIYDNLLCWYPMQDGDRGNQGYVLDGSNSGSSIELWNNDYSSDIGGWIAYSTNTLDYGDNAIIITGDGSNANGAYLNFASHKDLSHDLVVGCSYTLTCQAKVNSGSDVKLHINNLAINQVTVNSTEYQTFTFNFIADSATGNYIRTQQLADDEIIHIKNFSLKGFNLKSHGTSTFYGDELLTNTDFASNASGWTAGTNMTLSSNSGVLKVLNNTDGTSDGFASQSVTTVVGRTYRAQITLKTESSGNQGEVYINNSVATGSALASDTDIAVDDVVDLTFVATATTTHLVLKNSLTSNNRYSEWDNASIKEVGFATGWTDADVQPIIPQLGFQSFNQLAWFDGTADYANVANNSAIDMGTGDFTISCWVMTNGAVSSNTWLVDRNHVTAYSIYIVSGGAVKVAIHGSYLSISGHDIDDGRWHHVVASYDRSGNLNVYIDGVLAGTSDISGDTEDLDNSSALGIGRSTSSGGYLNGCITEVSLWKGEALTLAKVQELYNDGETLDATLHSSVANLSGYWRNKGNTTWTDLSTNSNNGTPTSVTENLILPEGQNGRDIQGFLMNRERTSGLNLPYKNSGGQRVSYVDAGAQTISAGTDFTIAFWAKPVETYNTQNVMGASATDYVSFSESGNDVRLLIRADNNSVYEEFDSDDVHNTNDLEKWQYWTITRGELASNQLRFYLNGRINNTGANITTHAFAHDMDLRYLGNLTSASTPFRGVLDDMVIYNSTALTPAQVLRNYKAGKRRHKN
jgi:hypothetical protein